MSLAVALNHTPLVNDHFTAWLRRVDGREIHVPEAFTALGLPEAFVENLIVRHRPHGGLGGFLRNTAFEEVPFIDGVCELDVLEGVADALGTLPALEPEPGRWSRARRLAHAIADRLGVSLEGGT